MGKRYTKEEKSQIQALTHEDHTIKEIAEILGRPEAGIRNIQYRMKLKTKTKQSLEDLRQDEKDLTRRVSRLRRDIQILEGRRDTIKQALEVEDKTINVKLQAALRKLKDQKPELFHITFEEQIGKIAVELTGAFIRHLIS